MKKLSAVVLSTSADSLLKELQRLKCSGIEKITAPVEPDEKTAPSEEELLPEFVAPEEIFSAAELPENDVSGELSALNEQISSLSAAIAFLDEAHTAKNPLFHDPESLTPEEFEKERLGAAKEAAERALEIKGRITAARRRITELNAKIEGLRPFIKLKIALPESRTEKCDIICGTLPSAAEFSAVEKALSDFACVLDTVCETKTARGVCLTVLRSQQAECLSALSSFGFVKATVSAKAENGFAAGEAERCAKEIERISTDAEKDGKLAEELANKKLGELKTYLDYLNTATARARESGKMRMTGRCAVIGAYVPEKAQEKVTKLLEDNAAAYEFTDPAPEKENVPVLLSNGAVGSQFEPIVGLYSYPAYGAFDPTSVMSFFYILIFGLMFADVGYGLTLLLGCLLGLKLMHPREGLAKFLRMFAMCGVSSMVGGVLFGGYFGDLPARIMEDFFGLEKAPELALCFNMVDNPMAFLGVALAAGAVHLLCGMGIKFWLLWKDGHPFAAIFDVGSWFVLFAGIGLFFVLPTAGIVCALVGVAMLVLSQGRAEKNPIMKLLKGIMSLYDLVSYGSDLLSYSRILALSLASAVIANVVNIFATMGGPGIGGVISLILAFAIGHTLNFAVNILGTYVHTSRLQYIEFFGKFYEDGGRPFAPLAPETKYVLFK